MTSCFALLSRHYCLTKERPVGAEPAQQFCGNISGCHVDAQLRLRHEIFPEPRYLLAGCWLKGEAGPQGGDEEFPPRWSTQMGIGWLASLAE
jgi:hypothetical protein